MQGQADLKHSLEQAEPKLSALKKCIADLEAKNKGGTEDYLTKRHSPFTGDVLMEPLPEKLKILQVVAYEGDGDPLSHLEKYTSWMELQEASNAIMCRALPLTLGDKAQRWFRRLHERLVLFSSSLAKGRLAHCPLKSRVSNEELVSIKQGKCESLKSYLSRFNKQSMEMEKISDDTALMAVLVGLRPKIRFWWSVHEDGPRTYHEFLNRAEKYISAEEATSDQEKETSKPDLNNIAKEKKPSHSPQPERKKDRRERERHRAQP
ncbi:uncharacterized protein LOC111398323 [Olea europaea var. sylvestris]|uniref:uncharacterized protein LOC111398323 n=1 Tax=Olea europaea var. sylvestris TaxID=158386 RepID=UPI000C1CFE4A|nr:uncharacterized protein LOC111398323 [Olea europaea var. sylvestris]